MAETAQGRSHAGGGVLKALKVSPLCNTCVVWSAFLVSRLLLLFTTLVLFPGIWDSDIRIYARYANACALASARGGSVYDYCRPEYPHLALAVMALPRACMTAAPAEAGDPPGLAEYRGLYRVEMALFDLLAFLTALRLVHGRFGAEPVWFRTKRLLAFVAGGLLLGTLLYTRLDVVLGALILLSLALLVSRLHYAWSFAVLAAAVNFKLVPVVLIPLWVVASLPPALVGDAWDRGGVRRLLAVCCWRSALAVALTVALSVPAYLSSGGRCLDFLAYHNGRGLEVGSLYSTALLLLKPFGCPSTFGYGYSSINIDSPAAGPLVHVSPYVTLGLVLAATSFSCRLMLRRKYEASQGGPAPGSANGGNPAGDLACCACLVLGAFIAGNKVLSPQYLLWLAPLIPLLTLPRRRLCTLTFAAACALSTVVMLAWQRHVVGVSVWVEPVTSVGGPTALGSVLLIARNVVLVGFILLLGVGLAGMAGGPSPEPGESPGSGPVVPAGVGLAQAG